MESTIEIEEEYKMCIGEDIAIFEPTIDVKDGLLPINLRTHFLTAQTESLQI